MQKRYSISIASLYGEEQRDDLSPISEMVAVIVDLVQETTEATGTAAAVCEQDMHVVTEPPPPEHSSPPAQPTPPTDNDPRPMSMRSFSFPDGDWIPDVLRHTDLLEAMEEISFRGDVPLYVYGGVNVSTRDLANMQDGSFIRDEAINLFGALFNADVHPRAHVFPTQFGLALSDSDFTRTLTNYQQTVVPGEYPMLYFPVNIARCHWVLVVADVINKTLVYLDSIFNPYLGVPHWVLTVGECMNARMTSPITWSVRNGQAPQQLEGGNDCGLAVIVNILRSFRYGIEEVRYDASCLRSFRQRLKIILMYCSLTPPEEDILSVTRDFHSQLTSGGMGPVPSRRRSMRARPAPAHHDYTSADTQTSDEGPDPSRREGPLLPGNWSILYTWG